MNLGIIGRARSGKDTAGKYFVDGHGYRRVAFADPLKEAALTLNPWVAVGTQRHGFDDYSAHGERLSDLVWRLGWEGAKDCFPEVRRILQELGSAVRAVDEDFWLRQALKATQEANDSGVPVVITDVRYRNEAASLVRAGFHLLHIARPGAPRMDHESENSLGPTDARYLVVNDGTIEQLHARLERIWEEIHAMESARFALKF